MREEFREVIIIEGQDLSARAIQGATRNLSAFQRMANAMTAPLRTLGSGFNTLTRGAMSFGNAMLSGLGIGGGILLFMQLGRAIGGAIGQFVEFDHMIRASATLDPTFEKNMGAFSEQILQISERTGFATGAIAKAVFEALSAGVKAGEVITFIDAAATAAIAGLTDTETAVNGLTNIINAWNLSVTEAGRLNDIIFRAIDIGKVTYSELATEMSTAGPIAAAMGINFEQIAAASATMTRQGITVGESFTNIRSFMVALINPSEQLKSAYKDLGFASGEAMLAQLGLQGSFEIIREYSDKTGVDLQSLLGRVQAMQAVFTTTGEQTEGARADLDAISNSAGATARAYDIMAASIRNTFNRLKSTISAALIRDFEKLTPGLTSFIEELTRVAPGAIHSVTRNIGMLVSALSPLAGPLLLIRDVISAVFQELTGERGALGVVGDIFEKVFGLNPANNIIRPFLEIAMRLIRTVHNIGKIFRGLLHGDFDFKGFINRISLQFELLGGTIRHEAEKIGGLIWTWLVDEAIPTVKTEMNRLMDKVKDWATGGGPERLRVSLRELQHHAWLWLRQAGHDASGFLGDYIIEPIKNWANSTGPGKTRDALAGLAGSVWLWLSGVGSDAAFEAETHLIGPLREWANGPGGEATRLALSTLGDNVWLWLTTAKDNAATFLHENIIVPIGNWVDQGGPAKVGDALKTLGQQMWMWVSIAADKVVIEMEPLLASIKDWILVTAAPALKEASKSIGTLIYEGINNGFQEARNTESPGAGILDTLGMDLAAFGQVMEDFMIPDFLISGINDLWESFKILHGWMTLVAETLVGNALTTVGDLAKPVVVTIAALAGTFALLSRALLLVLSGLESIRRFIAGNPTLLETVLAAGAGPFGPQASEAPENPGSTGPSTDPGGSQNVAPSGARVGAAHGGIVSGAQRLLVGERGPEAIIPLDMLRGSGGGFGGISIGSLSVPLNFSGEAPRPEDAEQLARRVAPAVVREINKELRRLRPGVVGGY